MILALLYGEGDFDRTLAIGCMCGWDTDCNVGNISTIMGVRGGLNAINYRKFREPVNDFLACSSVIGSLNNMDIPYGALYITKLAYALAGETPPEPWKDIIDSHIDACHFEFPGSTHAMHVKTDDALKQEESLLLTAHLPRTNHTRKCIHPGLFGSGCDNSRTLFP